MVSVPLPLATAVARAARWASRRSGRGGGTNLPGRILLAARPTALADLGSDFTSGTVTVSATNGKTTTTRMIGSGLDAAGLLFCTNLAGANLTTGVAAALLQSPAGAQVGLFEVDEAALADVTDQLQPRVVVLMNLFRDQLDRYGELDTLLDRWRDLVAKLPPTTTLVLNADDPGIASLTDSPAQIVWFGVDAPQVRASRSHAVDSTRCRQCNAELDFAHHTIGHFGDWSCPNCDSRRPTPDITVVSVEATDLAAQTLRISTPEGDLSVQLGIPGAHNAYNAAAAVGVLSALGVSGDHITAGLGSTAAAFGRGEHIDVDGRAVWLHLAKNPTGTNQNIRTVLTTEGPLHVFALLNDRTADGQDVSWIWDVDWEPLLDRVATITISGDRCHELALRFKYAGFDMSTAQIDPDPGAALDLAISAAPVGAELHVLPTYTAMLDLRSELTRRGLTQGLLGG